MVRVRFVKDHIHAGVGYAAGSTLEVEPKVFEKLHRVGAAVPLEIEVPSTSSVQEAVEQAAAVTRAERQEGRQDARRSGGFMGRRRRG